MTQGNTETTRGTTSYTRAQSHIAKRNATQAELETARATYTGQPVKLPTHPYARFICTGVRLDDLNRLIFDLEREMHKQIASPDEEVE